MKGNIRKDRARGPKEKVRGVEKEGKAEGRKGEEERMGMEGKKWR